MLRFTLFGFPVTIHWGFWIMTALLGGALDANNPVAWQALLLWIVAVFISILIHELGHTFMQRHFGARAQILLYSFGGLAIPDRSFSRQRQIIVSLAGPLVEIFCGLIVMEIFKRASIQSWQLRVFVHSFYFVSVFWGILNLVPIYPLDGGHVLLHTLGPRHERTSFIVGALCAAALALFMLIGLGSIWNTIFFGLLAWQNFQRAQGHRPPPFFMPR